MTRGVVVRLLITMVIGLLFGWVLSEGSFFLTGGKENQAQHQVVITIPLGTAELVAQGKSVPTLPDSMTFYQGDLLIVRNEDSVNHQLGPLFIPAQSSGVLALDQSSDLSYACSFEPGKKFGLNVQPILTENIRIEGVLAVGLPSGILLWLYSLVAIPVREKKHVPSQNSNPL